MCRECGRPAAGLVRGLCKSCYEYARRQAAAAGQPFSSEPGGVCTRCGRSMSKIRCGLCNTCYQADRRAAANDPAGHYTPADLAVAVGCPVAVVRGWMAEGLLPAAPDGSLSEAGIARFLRNYPALWRCYPCPVESSAWRRALLLDVAPPHPRRAGGQRRRAA